jgi:hypothetical protein
LRGGVKGCDLRKETLAIEGAEREAEENIKIIITSSVFVSGPLCLNVCTLVSL